MLITEAFPNSKQNGFGANYKVTQENVDGVRTRDKISLICLVCGHEFSQRANSIFLGVVSCKCSKSYRKTKDELKLDFQANAKSLDCELLDIKYLRPLADSIGTIICNLCKTIRDISYSSMASKGTSCVKCSGKYRPTTDEYLHTIRNKLPENTNLISWPDKIVKDSVVEVCCSLCNVKSSKTVAAIIYHNSQCSCTANWGFDNSKESCMYLIRLTKNSTDYYKIGITCNLSRRVREFENKNSCDVAVLSVWKYPANSKITEHEQLLKDYFAHGRSKDKPFESGYTEVVEFSSLPELIIIQNLQYRAINNGFSSW